MNPYFSNKTLTQLILITQTILLIWSIVSYLAEAGSWSAALVTYTLYIAYVLYCFVSKDSVLIHLVLFATIAGFLELFADQYMVNTLSNKVYPQNEAMILSAPIYMPFIWANIIIQIGYYAFLLSKWKGWGAAAFIIGVAGCLYIPLFDYLAKDAGWWWYNNSGTMIFNTPVYLMACKGLICLSLPLLLLKLGQRTYTYTAFMGTICGIWIYVSTVVSFWK